MSFLLDAIITTTLLSTSLFLYLRPQSPPNHYPIASHSYILLNTTSHTRYLPTPSKHSFTYPTLSFLLSLRSLERHHLDLGRGLVFGYGGVAWRICGLRAGGYLLDYRGAEDAKEKPILEKLVEVLRFSGYEMVDNEGRDVLGEVWMMTMPSFLGFEGINPLTVYYCYKARQQALWITILEVHNTFGERHVYVLEVGKGEDVPCTGFDHTWTFPRAFHVSPFNDRNGFYTVSITRPSHPPHHRTPPTSNPIPKVRVQYFLPLSPEQQRRLPISKGPLLLSASLTPHTSKPLTTTALLGTLARYPLVLVLTLPRILWQAGILHYGKGLRVWARPEPKGVWALNSELKGSKAIERGKGSEVGSFGVGWQSESLVEKYMRKRVERFLERRVEGLEREGKKVEARLVSGNPLVPNRTFAPSQSSSTEHSHPASSSAILPPKTPQTLTINYLSPRFFTFIFTSPSPAHALLIGSRAEKIFSVSDTKLFLDVFSAPDGGRRSWRQYIRTLPIPKPILSHASLPIPPLHPLDAYAPDTVDAYTPNKVDAYTPNKVDAYISNLLRAMMDVGVLCVLMMQEAVERWVFWVVGARFVTGGEPWRGWERAGEVLDSEGVRAGE
ncbi:hypothetical protein JAAARDRAFT_208159 [Jaapia argillacea MUCL 33604]|uniref:DUF1365-domain-containing protein n=1 Tax=Jaapia argillacea MUCL 33604 TaxID=933084 RepID=A0A067PQ14_9AGAM|nr:hypothetical protein JAAARDRAFT_208159 [Jaapia argillacea MUCL 33604]